MHRIECGAVGAGSFRLRLHTYPGFPARHALPARVGAISYASSYALQAVGAYYGDAWSFGRVIAEGAVGGVSAEALGGDFWDGFWIAAGSSAARGIYRSTVRYRETWGSGGDAVKKEYTQHPVEGVNNVGTQGGNVGSTFASEGAGLSRFLNRIPGVNAVAGLHDHMTTAISDPWRGILNVPLMIPAAALTSAALIAPHSTTMRYARMRHEVDEEWQ